MSDLLRRAQQVQALAGDPSLPKWQRLSQALQALSGLDFTGIPREVRERFEADLGGVNRVLGRYALEKVEDYESISDIDLQRMLEMVNSATSWAVASELDRIVAGLDAGVKKLPVEAIQEAREHRDVMVPRLIEVLRDAVSASRAGDVPEGDAHFFAIFLLTEFQAEEAFPTILEAFSLPEELPFALFEDAVTETLPRILALFVGDRPEVLDGLIADRALNEYVRWEAAESYVYLVRDGRLTRDEAVQRLQQHLRRAIDLNDAAIAGPLVSVLTSFSPVEALADITEAFDRGLVEPVLVDMDDVKESIAEGEAGVHRKLERCPATGIKDTIEELRHWAAFEEEPAQRRASLPPLPHFATAREPAELVTAPMLSRGQRVGRNEPCPCGSGKKFKKCCGARK